MAKKGVAKIDEDMMRKVMTGEIPARRLQDIPPSEPIQEHGEPPEKKEEPEPARFPAAKPAAKRKRREEPQGYEEKFLTVDNSKDRVTVKMDRELFRKLRSLLSVIAPELTLVSYLNSIVADHLEFYSDEINELFDNKFQKPI